MTSEETTTEVGGWGLSEEGRDMRSKMGLLSEQELSVLLGVQERTLQRWRYARIGPDFVRIRKLVFYRRGDVEQWIACNVIATRRVMGD